ncbi:HlyD family secretion protein [Moraxella nasibovis]|uniref:HlyD family secretion protein n=1 Tax=Moraxella nasibovis TaxID=2904120 RepID=UPI00240F45EF|nr:HlyD family secretion protein [Moraxella nasibovis]WFF38655.1 HlyD family secretion protein [Moraxella nasibovis]
MTDNNPTNNNDLPNDAQSAQDQTWQPKKKSPAKRLLVLALLIAGVIGILYAYQLPPFSPSYIETNNAYVRGKPTQVSPKVAGYVRQIMVQDYQFVEKGQPLVQIETDQYEMRLAQAKAGVLSQQATLGKIKQAQNSAAANVAVMDANIESAKVNLANAKAQHARLAELVKMDAVSRQDFENSLANVQKAEIAVLQAQAQKKNAEQEIANVVVNEKSNLVAIDNAKAGLELAELELSQTLIKAPISGRLNEILVKEGQLVAVGANLMSIVPSDLWIVANVKETEISQIAIGQPATITVDALGSKQVLTGKVVQIAPATGSEFSVNKTDPSTGNFIKVAQRVPVKIAFDNPTDASQIQMGMSAVVRIDKVKE